MVLGNLIPAQIIFGYYIFSPVIVVVIGYLARSFQ